MIVEEHRRTPQNSAEFLAFLRAYTKKQKQIKEEVNPDDDAKVRTLIYCVAR
jgi:hypothetical protein